MKFGMRTPSIKKSIKARQPEKPSELLRKL